MSGINWFDNRSDRTLAQKIKRAIDYYEEKYGQTPNVCRVHPSEYDPNTEIKGLNVIPYHSVLPGHMWIGYYTGEELEEDLPAPSKGFFELNEEESDLLTSLKEFYDDFRPYLRTCTVLLISVSIIAVCSVISIFIFLSLILPIPR